MGGSVTTSGHSIKLYYCYVGKDVQTSGDEISVEESILQGNVSTSDAIITIKRSNIFGNGLIETSSDHAIVIENSFFQGTKNNNVNETGECQYPRDGIIDHLPSVYNVKFTFEPLEDLNPEEQKTEIQHTVHEIIPEKHQQIVTSQEQNTGVSIQQEQQNTGDDKEQGDRTKPDL